MKQEEKKYILENFDKKSAKELARELGLKERKVKKFLQLEKPKKPRVEVPQEPLRHIPATKKTIILSIALIIFMGMAVYANSINGQFIWDDYHLIKENAYVKNWSNLGKIFTSGIREGAHRISNTYRPLQMLTYMVDYSIGGMNVRGYHLVNISFHILVALCIYWLINILFADNLIALLTAALYAVHPIHTEAVAYIAGRADPLAFFFMLTALIFYIKNVEKAGIGKLIIVAASYILAILSKESSLILPAVILLYHFTFKRKMNAAGFSIVMIITAAYLILRTTALKVLLFTETSYPTTVLQRLPGFFAALTGYFRLLFLPLTLHMEYTLVLFKFTDPHVIFGIVLLILILAWALIKRNKRIVFFSIAWFLLTLLPLSDIYPLNAYMYEHWMYVPSVGFFLLLSAELAYLYRTRSYKKISLALIVILALFYSALTIRQNAYWQEPISFFKRTLKYVPQSARIHNDLGYTYYKMEKMEDAITSFKASMQIDPAYTLPYNNLGVIYTSAGKYGDAAETYEKLTKYAPSPDAYINLGSSYFNMGKKEEAINAFKKALELKPDSFDAVIRIADAYFNLNDGENASIFYKKAMGMKPDFAGSYMNLGNIYVNGGRMQEGIDLYNKALSLDPKQAAAHNNLAVTYLRIQNYPAAIEHCDRAIAMGFKVDPALLEALKPFRKGNQ